MQPDTPCQAAPPAALCTPSLPTKKCGAGNAVATSCGTHLAWPSPRRSSRCSPLPGSPLCEITGAGRQHSRQAFARVQQLQLFRGQHVRHAVVQVHAGRVCAHGGKKKGMVGPWADWAAGLPEHEHPPLHDHEHHQHLPNRVPPEATNLSGVRPSPSSTKQPRSTHQTGCRPMRRRAAG